MKGAELLVDTLVQVGVRRIFSLSGNQIMPVYDALIDSGIPIVHVRHEAAAVYMADAWAQITGEPGVALVTAGPGLGNTIASLFCARHSESPVLILSGDSPIGADGDAVFQEMAQTDVTRSVVKAALRPARAERVGHEVGAAVSRARSGRPGPVHVALPFDVLNAATGGAGRVGTGELARRPRVLPAPAAGEVAGRITRAERPIVLTGPCMNRSRNGARLAVLEESLGAPVVPVESPRGLRDPALGAFAGALARADLVVFLGKTVDYSVGFVRPPVTDAAAELVVIDPDEHAIERAHRLAGGRIVFSACADPDLAAEAVAAAASGTPAPGRVWREEVEGAVADRTIAVEIGARPHPKAVCEAVQRVLDAAADPILICDGGEFGQWTQAFCTAPTRIVNGLSGAIGCGLPHALAAKLARPEATVVTLLGDGTAGFHFTEFDTAAREGAAFVSVIGNDFRWNAEHQIQLRNYGPDRLIGCGLSPSARYDLAASAFGCHGEHVTNAVGLDAALARALASGRPACVNVEIDGVAAPVFSPMAGGGRSPRD